MDGWMENRINFFIERERMGDICEQEEFSFDRVHLWEQKSASAMFNQCLDQLFMLPEQGALRTTAISTLKDYQADTNN